MTKQITKKMHFVPRFYLKGFKDKSEKFYILDMKTKRIKYIEYQGVFYEKFFYSIITGVEDRFGQEIEKVFSKIETPASETFDKFKKDIIENKHISEDMILNMSEITTFFYLRTKAFRDFLKKRDEDMIGSVLELAKKIDKPKKTNKINFLGKEMTFDELENLPKYLNKDNTRHFKTISDFWKMYETTFFVKKWKVYIASEEQEFLTFDNPVMDIYNKDCGFWGNHIFERKHFFVVSPKILIEFINPDKQSKKLKRERVKDDFVHKKNMELARYSNRFIVSKDKKVLDLLKTYLR